MAQDQPDLFRDYLPTALYREGVDGLFAFEIYCAAIGIDPSVDCDETRAARRVIQRTWEG
jgi:hypothetical protein